MLVLVLHLEHKIEQMAVGAIMGQWRIIYERKLSALRISCSPCARVENECYINRVFWAFIIWSQDIILPCSLLVHINVISCKHYILHLFYPRCKKNIYFSQFLALTTSGIKDLHQREMQRSPLEGNWPTLPCCPHLQEVVGVPTLYPTKCTLRCTGL